MTKEALDGVRAVEGFPIGTDEDIIAVSDAPCYTACPNPFAADYVRAFGRAYDAETDDYRREPFAADVSEGKTDAVYNAHIYHTKVPYKAIMRYILHYTEPGDLVFDGFCGTGMTGVAANMCEHPEPAFRESVEREQPGVQWGRRHPILNDLSPIATLIAYNYNNDIDVAGFEREARSILEEAHRECDWMFETAHSERTGPSDPTVGTILQTVWSDVLICPRCGNEIVFYNAATDPATGKVSERFRCGGCGAELKKDDCEKAFDPVSDPATGARRIIRQKPVLIRYQYGKKRFDKAPDARDLEVIRRIEATPIPYWYPTDRMCEGRESRRNDRIGLTHVHQFFYRRTLYVLAKLYDLICRSDYRDLLTILFTSQIINISRMNRYRPQVSFPYNPLSGTMYVASMVCEANPFRAYEGKIRKFADALKQNNGNDFCISTGSATELPIPSESCDYIFTDPPFGGNLNYSELSFLWEAWLRIRTNSAPEAIVNSAQEKDLPAYQTLMTRSFQEYYRILKPNRWMTVEFHNSKNEVWNAIQVSLRRAGFVVADVRTLDKQGDTFKVVTAASAVKQDLILSAYKPGEASRQVPRLKDGTEENVWQFVERRLAELPVTVRSGGALAPIPERQAYLLFDRMVAYHVVKGLSVPLDAHDFYAGLDARFAKRDGMYFLPEQAEEFDRERAGDGAEHHQ